MAFYVRRNYADSFVNAADNEDLNEIADTFKEDELIHFGESHHRAVVVKASHVDEVSGFCVFMVFFNKYFIFDS